MRPRRTPNIGCGGAGSIQSPDQRKRAARERNSTKQKFKTDAM
jgi:hypothetical protein